MRTEIKYQLPFFSQTLSSDPIIKFDHLDVIMKLEGYDEKDYLRKVCITFEIVQCYKHTSEMFTPKLYGAYDKVVELKDSTWIQEMKKINEEKFRFWQLRHFAVYLDSIGMYEFMAQGCKVETNE